MCGLAGYLNLNGDPASLPILRRMTAAIAHRGPDGDGCWIDGALALGHRRLAIIELSDAGRQPMQTADGRHTLVYNGELYNYLELRAELQGQGAVFHSGADSEVVLQALARWGEAALARFNGMFALALWDARERRLLLARDRFGVKPLYIAEAGGAVLFGSEVKAILAHPARPARLDPAGLREYLTFQNFYGERTLFEGVLMIPPGVAVTVEAGSGAIRRREWWRFRFAEKAGTADETALGEELRRLFKQAVTRQLVADVEVGAYLSGGMDSGSVAAVAAASLPHLRTFTCGFDVSSASGLELYFDERRDAERMSARMASEHYEMVLKAGDMERILPRLARHMEEPRVGQCYPNFYIAGLASKFNRVVLSGTGGDELFAGYPWRYALAYDPDPSRCRDNLFASWQRLLPHTDHRAIFAPIWSEVADADPRAAFEAKWDDPGPRARPEELLNAILTFEARTFLQGLLTMEDKVAMAHGLEVRVPFLDNDLVDFAQGLPLAHKIGDLPTFLDAAAKMRTPDPARRNDGKHLLRRALEGIVPPDIARRDKQGFSAPDASWFKGQSIDYVKARVGQPRARIYRTLAYDAIAPHLESHFSGRENRRLLIWSLLALEQAFEQFALA